MKRRISNHSFFLLNIAAYVTLIMVAFLVLREMTAGADRWLATGLFILFGILQAFYPRLEHHPRYVHLYLAAQTAVILTIYNLEPSASLDIHTLFFVLSAEAMLFLPALTGMLWIVALTVLTFVGALDIIGWTKAISLLPSLGGYAFFGTFGAALRQANEARQASDRLLGELQVAHQQLQAYAFQAQQLAVADERNRLAREMHDSLGHSLTVAVVQLEGAQRLIPTEPERAAQMISSMRAQLKAGLGELRQTLAGLRAREAEETVPALESLAAAVAQLVETFQQATNLTIHLNLPPDLPQLPMSHRLALYRTIQECLTNVQRHAVASQAWLTINVTDELITLVVADNGRGIPDETPDGRFGLMGLQERATQLGGHLYLETHASGGAQIRLQLPIPAGNGADPLPGHAALLSQAGNSDGRDG